MSGVWNAWSEVQKIQVLHKKINERHKLNELFELHSQGKGKFPLGVDRVKSGGWVGLGGVSWGDRDQSLLQQLKSFPHAHVLTWSEVFDFDQWFWSDELI